jgi:apolipoprotein N-acyltransferase
MNDQTNAPLSPKPVKSGNERNFAVAGLVCGVLGLLAIFFGFNCVPFALLGLVFGYYGRRSDEKKNLATIGMILGGLGILIAGIWILVLVMRLLGPR